MSPTIFLFGSLLLGPLYGPTACPRGPQQAPAPPPARALSRALTAAPRLAGTAGSRLAIELVAHTLEEAGFEVTLDRREVLLSYPRRLEVVAHTPDGETLFDRCDRFDPDAWPPQDIPLFHGWSASGTAEGPVVDVGHGQRTDFEALVEAGVALEGRIALARYGRGYRGVKAELAQAFGCAGLLIFNDPLRDGAQRGAVWPEGPWKPGWEAERGAILSIARAPGDPSTPGWPSPAPGLTGERLSEEELIGILPRIPSLPLGSEHALELLANPGARVRMEVDAPRSLRTITNVIGELKGTGERLVLAGNHRDSWVRGANDAGSGTVSLLRCAQILGKAVRNGWQPRATILLGFWDAEEFGLIGSTEWAEAQGPERMKKAAVYINADAVVAGTRVSLSGTPGLESLVTEALERVPAPGMPSDKNLADQWRAQRRGEEDWRLGLVGSGSDYTVFLHHLGVPVIDVSFGGNRGGQYHTSFDDFEVMDRWLDPTWEGHETAALLLAELLRSASERERVFDQVLATQALAEMVRRAGLEERKGDVWLGTERAEILATALDDLATAIDAVLGAENRPSATTPGTGFPPELHRALQRAAGLPERPWFRNVMWAPGLETGYAAETLPTLRLAADAGAEDLDRELELLREQVQTLGDLWRSCATPESPQR